MGCCLTTAAAAAAAAAATTKIQPKTRDTSPPESGQETETVKEILSETPVTSQKPPPATTSTTTTNNTNTFQIPKNPVSETASEVSSELYTYSYTASLSAATTTTIGTTIEADEDGEVTQKVNKPPPVKLVSRRRVERGVRPPSPSPARKPVVRSTDKNSRLTSRVVTTGYGNRNVVSSNVVGRENCVRRVRSPVVREVGRVRKVKEGSTVKLKKTNEVSPVPVPVPVPETEKERGRGIEAGESLDNPLVSLECFIFL
ncbi:hypothetical protein HanRHA438_Chr17g0818881 [Helianthus annuus]|nr:hypothetical protein HanRHA438_Chr17g0818881 [Helianthus annuus]